MKEDICGWIDRSRSCWRWGPCAWRGRRPWWWSRSRKACIFRSTVRSTQFAIWRKEKKCKKRNKENKVFFFFWKKKSRAEALMMKSFTESLYFPFDCSFNSVRNLKKKKRKVRKEIKKGRKEEKKKRKKKEIKFFFFFFL